MAAALLCAGPASAARVIACSFTEPFARTLYDPARGTLTIVRAGEARRQVQTGIAARQVSGAVLELRNGKGEVVQHLERSSRGSDGMGERSYPYAVRWMPRDPSLPETLSGGCE